MAASITFQSRNRGSFGFKGNFWYQLAIRASSFRSRNRGSFGFKPVTDGSVTGAFAFLVSISQSRFF